MTERPRTPSSFNVAAIGFAIATFAGSELAIFARPVVTGGVTLGIAWVWALLPRLIRREPFLPWWLAASTALAALDAGLVLAIHDEDSGSLYAGVTIGAIVWVPMLWLTLVTLGTSILAARRWSSKGARGTRNGERVVAAVAAAVCVVGLLLSRDALNAAYRDALESERGNALEMSRPVQPIDSGRYPPNPVDRVFLYGCGALGILCAGVAAVKASVSRLRPTD